MRKILSCIIAALLLGIIPASAEGPDLNGSWILSKLIYKNVIISANLSTDSGEKEKVFSLVLDIVGDRECRLIFDNVAYEAQINKVSGNEYTINISDNSFKLMYMSGEEASLHLTNDLTLILKKSDKKRDFSGITRIEDLLIEEEREVALQRSIAEAKTTALAAIKPASVYDMHVSFSSEETKKMSLFMNYGRYYVSNDTMIGMAYDKSGFLPNLVKCEVIKDGDTLKQDVFTVLDRHVNANFLTAFDNQLYYIRVDRDSGMSSIARLNLKAEEIKQIGSEMHEMAYLQIHDGRLWYTGDGHRLYSCLLNGKDNRIELDKTVYEPYFIAEDWLIYQDDEDGETLHIRCIKDGTDLKITAERSFNPVVDGTVLYFTSIPDNGGKAYLSRIDLSKPFKEGDMCFGIEKSDLAMSIPFYIADSTIYGDNNSLVSVEDWKKLTNSAWLAVEQRVFLVSERYNIYGEMYSEHATVTNLYLYDRISGEKSVFRHVY